MGVCMIVHSVTIDIYTWADRAITSTTTPQDRVVTGDWFTVPTIYYFS